MKKFTLLAAAAFAALSMNAQTLYLCGNDFGWTPESPVELTPTDGVYSFKSSGDFKISTTKGDWNTFNSGAMGYNGKNLPAAGTYDLQAWGENIVLPYAGEWDVKIFDVNTSARTAKITISTDAVKTYTVLYMMGVNGNWNTSAPKFETTDGVLYTIDNVSLAANTSFKIADANWSGASNWGSGNGVSAAVEAGVEKKLWSNANSTNLSLAAAYNGPVQFNAETETLILGEFSTPEPPAAEEINFVLEGIWDSWTDVDFEKADDNVYTLKLNVDDFQNGYAYIYGVVDGAYKYQIASNPEAQLTLTTGDNTLYYDIEDTVGSFIFPSEWAGKDITLTLNVPENAPTGDELLPVVLNVKVGGEEPVAENAFAMTFDYDNITVTRESATEAEVTVPYDVTEAVNVKGLHFWVVRGPNAEAGETADVTIGSTDIKYGARGEVTIPVELTSNDQIASYVKCYAVYEDGNESPWFETAVVWIPEYNNSSDGVEVVAAENGEAQYFNLQGVRVANPENGIFIRVENGKAVKVVR